MNLRFSNKIIPGNCIDSMQKLSDECVDLTVTSPPYDNLRDYKGYSFDFEDIAKELFRVTKEGGVVVWVVGDAVKEGSETGTSFRQALYFKDEIGFTLHDTMIYQKDGVPFPEINRYIQAFEYMFVLTKGAPKTFNPIKVPTKGYKGHTPRKTRQADGSFVRMKGEVGVKDDRFKHNIWKYGVGLYKTTSDKFAFEHPATFPEGLARDHILSWTNKGDLVLDPMCGSGTTCKMAKMYNRNFIGMDISEEYCKIARRRVDDCERNLF